MNKFMNALTKVMFKVGEFGFKTLWAVWFILCTIIFVTALIPAILMDVIGHNCNPFEKQFGVVGAGYAYAKCIVMPLGLVGLDKMNLGIKNCDIQTFDQWYQMIEEDYKNGL